jgi:hypothetical protein
MKKICYVSNPLVDPDIIEINTLFGTKSFWDVYDLCIFPDGRILKRS